MHNGFGVWQKGAVLSGTSCAADSSQNSSTLWSGLMPRAAVVQGAAGRRHWVCHVTSRKRAILLVIRRILRGTAFPTAFAVNVRDDHVATVDACWAGAMRCIFFVIGISSFFGDERCCAQLSGLFPTAPSSTPPNRPLLNSPATDAGLRDPQQEASHGPACQHLGV